MKNPLRLSAIQVGIIAGSLLLASTTTFAHSNYKGDYKGEAAAPCPACAPVLVLRDGFYVGAQVGYDSYRSRINLSAVDADGASAANPKLAPQGWVGGLLAGYGQYFNNWWYLGAEVFVNGSGASDSSSVTHADAASGLTIETNSKISVNGSWGISLLPGVKVNDSTLAYVRLGYNQARIKYSASVNVDETATDADLFYASGSNRKWQGGFNYGVGLETAVYPNVSIRGEYTRTNYGSVSNSFSDAFGSTSASSKTTDNQGMLALIYHFA